MITYVSLWTVTSPVSSPLCPWGSHVRPGSLQQNREYSLGVVRLSGCNTQQQPRRFPMKRLFGLTIVAVTALSAAAMAATPERVRGTVASVTADSVTIHTADKDVTVGLTSNTRYLKVVKSSLNNL